MMFPIPRSPDHHPEADRDAQETPTAEAPFAPLPNHLQPLRENLMKAAIELLSYAERDEVNLFETVIGGQRLSIEIALLPRVGRDAAGAMRVVPVRPDLPSATS